VNSSELTPAYSLRPRHECQRCEPVFDAPPRDLREAICADIRAARRSPLGGGVNGRIGELCGVQAETVYQWCSRRSHAWTPAQLEAVVEATGGARIIRYLESVGARSEVVAGTPAELLASMAVLSGDVARLMRETMAALEDGVLTGGALAAALMSGIGWVAAKFLMGY